MKKTPHAERSPPKVKENTSRLSRFWPNQTICHHTAPSRLTRLTLDASLDISSFRASNTPTKKKRHPPKKCGSLEHLCSELSKKPSWSFQQSSEKSSNWNIFPKWGWKKNMFEIWNHHRSVNLWDLDLESHLEFQLFPTSLTDSRV